MNAPRNNGEACAIESIAHVAKKICLMWPSDELDGYFDQLILDSRNGQRKGFPVDVTQELVFLAEVNKKVRAIDMAQRTKIPLQDALRKVEEGDQARKDSGAIFDPMVSRELAHREEKSTNLDSQRRNYTRRSGQDRRQSTGENSSGTFSSLIFRIVTSKATLTLIIIVLAAKLLKPYFFPA